MSVFVASLACLLQWLFKDVSTHRQEIVQDINLSKPTSVTLYTKLTSCWLYFQQTHVRVVTIFSSDFRQ